MRSYSLGRRFTTRGSTRSGRSGLTTSLLKTSPALADLSHRTASMKLNRAMGNFDLLMDPKDAEDPLEAQQGQVGVRAEPPVSQADVAGLKRGMELHGLGHVVGPQWGRQKLPEQPRAGVKQNHQVGHRETAAGALVARLTEVFLQLGGIGHGATRPVHEEDPMAEPAALVATRGHRGSGAGACRPSGEAGP